MKIRKIKAQRIKYDEDNEPYVMYGKKRIMLDEFYREPARFIDDKLTYWHGLSCVSDLAIHLEYDDEGEHVAILGKIIEA